MIDTFVLAGAIPHYANAGSWLYPADRSSIELGWYDDSHWLQPDDSARALRSALRCDFDSLELCVSVGSPTEPVRELASRILQEHGGVAQVELGAQLWTADALRPDAAEAEDFASALLNPSAV